MPSDPTLTDAQRAEWDAMMEPWYEFVRDADGGLREPARTVIAVAERLTFLEADHARLVEENRRLREALHAQQRFVDHWNECEDCLAAMEPCFVAAELDGQATELRRAALTSPEATVE